MRKKTQSQSGFIHAFVLLFLLLALGLTVYFIKFGKTNFFSRAASSLTTDTSYPMKVLVLKYFPLTANGQNIDINYTGDVSDPYSTIRQKTIDVTNNLTSKLSQGTAYLGYKNSAAPPSLTYQVVDTKEYTQPVPLDPTSRRPLYNQILTDHNICNYVQSLGVNEVWLWAYQGPTYPGNQNPYLNISESKMASPFGDISNSPRFNDMPICDKTYRVYTFNYGRGTAEAMESWGHQMEAEMDAIDQNFFRNLFQGPNYPQTLGVNGRCGSAHNPPNARFEYDRGNPNPQNSDCPDWTADSLGQLSPVSCQNWGCPDVSDSNNASLNYMVWNWQNLPGRNNTKTYQGKQLRNLWDVHGNFDSVMQNNRTIFLSDPIPPSSIPVNVTDPFDRVDNSASLGTAPTGQVWESTKGVWGIKGNQAYSVDGCPAPGYGVVDAGSANVDVQVTLTVNAQDLRIPFWYKDLNNLYWVENVGSFYNINKMVNGNRSVIAEVRQVTPANGDKIRISLRNDTIRLYVNDILRLGAIDGSFTGTKHGLGNWCSGAIRFDTFPIPYPPPVVVDSTAPATSLTAPVNNATVSGAITVTALSTDAVGVTKVELYLDNTLLSTSPNSSPAASVTTNYSWNTKTTTDGIHQLLSKAYDAAGNAGQSSVVQVTVDNTGPQVTITKPLNGTTFKRNASVTISATASDPSGIAQITILVDGKIVKICNLTTSCQTTWLAAAHGQHIIDVSAVDNTKAFNPTNSRVTINVK